MFIKKIVESFRRTVINKPKVYITVVIPFHIIFTAYRYKKQSVD